MTLRGIGPANTELGAEKRAAGNIAYAMALGARIGPLAEVAGRTF